MKKVKKIVTALVLLAVLAVPTIASAGVYTHNGYYVNGDCSIGYSLDAWANTKSDSRVTYVEAGAEGDWGLRLAFDDGFSWARISVRNNANHGGVWYGGSDGVLSIIEKRF